MVAPQAQAAAAQLLCNLKSFALTLESDSVAIRTVAVPPPVTPDLPEPLTGAAIGADALKGDVPEGGATAESDVNGDGAAVNGAEAVENGAQSIASGEQSIASGELGINHGEKSISDGQQSTANGDQSVSNAD